MSVRFFIIDTNAEFRATLVQMLHTEWPSARIDQFDPSTQGRPGDSVQWAQYDVLFLDYDVPGSNGLKWYEALKRVADFPPTVILSANADPEVAVRAIKAGVENYLPKASLGVPKLKEVVREILNNAPLNRLLSDEQMQRENPNITHAPQPEKKKARVIRLSKKTTARDFWPEIKGYTVLKKIGQGGMSNVYLAERDADRTEVVVKTLSINLLENKKTVLRANQEFKLISRIRHPNIVTLYDQGTIGDVLYTTMEYFPKGDLKHRLRQGISQSQALAYLRQIAEGLNAIHGCGIIHRDLKPGNIMFRQDRSLAIIDFGISKDINSTLDLTLPGQIMGTPNYMAPEQGKGSGRPDARSDIYSLGVMLYEMLTGKKPYAAPSGAAIIYKHLHDPIPVLPNQFFQMQPLIDKMMAKSPNQRLQSAYDLLQFMNKKYPPDITLEDITVDFN